MLENLDDVMSENSEDDDEEFECDINQNGQAQLGDGVAADVDAMLGLGSLLNDSFTDADIKTLTKLYPIEKSNSLFSSANFKTCPDTVRFYLFILLNFLHYIKSITFTIICLQPTQLHFKPQLCYHCTA